MVPMKQAHNSLRKFFSLIGPWPIEPFYLGFLTFFMVASLYSIDHVDSHMHSLSNVLLRPIFSTAIAFLTMGQLKLSVKIFQGYEKVLATYLAILTIQSFSIWAWIVLFRNIFPAIHASFTAFLSPLPLIRFLFTLLSINAFIGLSRSRLSKALEEKEEALRIVENQRNLLLDYDETTRARFSEFLHDRVQSSLVTACLELQALKKNLDEASQREISKVVDGLETLRAVDVRKASQAFSPAVGNADLYTSISMMAESYAPHIKLTFPRDSHLEEVQKYSGPELFLGIYRIVEQSFLNSHIHGGARNFSIRIQIMDGYLVLVTENDGLLIGDTQKKGLGTAITNSWVRTLNGTWNIGNSGEKVRLEAVLPL